MLAPEMNPGSNEWNLTENLFTSYINIVSQKAVPVADPFRTFEVANHVNVVVYRA